MIKRSIQKNEENNQLESKDSNKGFTLVELSIVLLITGIISIPLIRLYTNYIYEQKIIATKENLATISRAIALSSPIRYPCPSDRSLPPSHANFGMDVCTLPTFSLASIPDCNTTGEEQGICKTPGARDTSDDPDNIAGNNNELVLIGGVPIRIYTVNNLGIPEPRSIIGTTAANILDGWQRYFTYAVSYTSSTPYRAEGYTRFKNGVIKVEDEWGQNTAGTDRNAHFIIISHGTDGAGAYNNSFVRLPCNLGNDDGQNCNGDSTFIQGVSHYGGSKKYDDYSYVQTDSSANLWQIVTDPLTNAPTSHIRTIPTGAIGVNMINPADPATSVAGTDIRLDVAGTIRADSVRTMEICRENGTSCIPIAGTNNFFGTKKDSAAGVVRNSCPLGQVINNIGNNRVNCVQPEIQFTNGRRCPLGTWIEQIMTNGDVKCTGGVDAVPCSVGDPEC